MFKMFLDFAADKPALSIALVLLRACLCKNVKKQRAECLTRKFCWLVVLCSC
eukprot:SAG31_NODE_42040_length_273_cov_0.873563_2_plen_51_part_01